MKHPIWFWHNAQDTTKDIMPVWSASQGNVAALGRAPVAAAGPLLQVGLLRAFAAIGGNSRVSRFAVPAGRQEDQSVLGATTAAVG